MFNHLDLFSGIGGFALAASWAWGPEHHIVSFCEIDPFCRKVLNKHWPDAPICTDIKTMKGSDFESVDLISGGFPCQPYSVAGKRKGKEDDRALWPEMFRVIQQAKPRWIIGENVAGFVNMGLDDCLSDLESEGYETTAFIIPACAVNAPHRRDRIWIVANRPECRRGQGDTNAGRSQKGMGPEGNGKRLADAFVDASHPCIERLQGSLRPATHDERPASHGSASERHSAWDEPWIEAATRLCGISDGVSDRVHRLKALGNAIVPQVVYEIMRTIREVEHV